MYNNKYNPYTEDNVARPITDLDLAFGIHPLSKDLRKKTNVEAIKQSLKSLCLLNHYEKPFHPNIGCDIYKSLFELFEESFTQETLEQDIKKMVNLYEPRADIQNVRVDANEEQNGVGITISFIPDGDVDVTEIDIFLRIQR